MNLKKKMIAVALVVFILFLGNIVTIGTALDKKNITFEEKKDIATSHYANSSLLITNLSDGRGQLKTYSSSPLGGSIVYAPLASRNTYMINEAGQITQSWTSNYLPGLSVYKLPDNSIYRPILVPGGIGGQGGGVQKIAADGTLLWEFIYINETVAQHHDIALLPNGNILLLAYEAKPYAEVIASGRNPQHAPNQLWPEQIVEVKPTGPTTGEIVWSWHIWDHLIQDFDSSKNNYGSVYNHPELADINYGANGADWLHANSLDYNAQLDQILISIHNFNEIWIIDHSTTTEQSSGHTGGLYGHGGDILYRWGNPEAYDRRTSIDKQFDGQHDARWIKDDYPGGGHILVFNNGMRRLYSSVDEIITPVDSLGNYILSPGQPFGPNSPTWSYTAVNFYAFHLSGAERLPNGNTLILHGEKGDFFVVNPSKDVVWTYSHSPIGVIFAPCFVPNNPPSGPDLGTVGSLSWTNIKPGTTISGSFQVKNIGTGRINWSINTSLLTWGTWTINPSSGYNYPGSPTLVIVTLITPSQPSSNFEGYIRVQNINNPTDYELVPVILTTSYQVGGQSTKISN